MSIVPKHLLKDLDYQKWYDWDFWLRPVGNGPYRYLRYQPGTMVELEANPDYYKGKPRIGRVVLKFSGEAGLTELLSGDVDTFNDFSPSQLPAIAKDARFTTYWGNPDFWQLTMIVWQNEHPLFRELGVRRALSLAINRRELLQVLNFSSAVSLVDGVYTGPQIQRGEMSASEPRYDPAEARRLLGEAGWQQGNGDGLRERRGLPFRFTALVETKSDRLRAALYVQDQLRIVGVQTGRAARRATCVLSKVRAGEFEAALGPQWGVLLERFLGGQSPAGYRNPRLATLFERLRTTAEPDVIDDTYREMSDLVRRDQPLAILYCPARATIVHRRVKGLSTPWSIDPLRFAEDLSLEDAEGAR